MPPKTMVALKENESVTRRCAIAQGVGKDGRKLLPPMGFAWYARMSQQDLDAIVAYLRTVPPKE